MTSVTNVATQVEAVVAGDEAEHQPPGKDRFGLTRGCI